MLSDLHGAENESVVEQLVGSRAIAGALVRMSMTSNHSDELQCVLSPAAWQQWGDWDNGHADS